MNSKSATPKQLKECQHEKTQNNEIMMEASY